MSVTTQRVFVGASERVPEGGRLVVDVGDKTIGIFRVEGKLHAWNNKCSHQGGPVCQGKIIPRVTEVIEPGGESLGFAFDKSTLHIVCPWHGWEFDVKTGQSFCDPSKISVRNYPMEVVPGTAVVQGPYVAETLPVTVEEQYVIVEMA